MSPVETNTKYCPFIVSPVEDKPAADCELEPNNQSAVVSIVMLSPMGKKEWQRTHDSVHHVCGSSVKHSLIQPIYMEINYTANLILKVDHLYTF